jgi:type I restriction enzyme S subunit
MSEWKEYKLGEVVTFQRGFDLPKDKMRNGEYPVAGSNGVIGWHSEYTTKGPGVTIGRSGNIGTPHFYKSNYWAHNTSLFVKDFKGNNSLFIYYFLKTIDFKQLNTGSAVPTLNRNHVHDLQVLVPPIDEQKRIAGVLSSLDDKIDLLNRENATLEDLAETLFRHYFIENPDPTWKEGKLGDYVIETIGGEWGTEVPEGESNMPVRCLRGADVADLNDGIATRTPLRYIKPSKYEKIKPNNGDIILEISGGTDTCSTGRVAYINDSVKHLFDYPIVFSNFCRLLRVKEKYMYFVYCYFRHLHKQGEFFNLENGSSGIHNLNYKAALYDDLGWPVPTDKKLVIEFGEKVKPYFDKINANKKQILSLSAQRDGILPRLMSGEVKMTESKITDKYILFNN